MEDVNELTSYNGTFHSRLFTKKFGKSVEEFRKAGTEFAVIGFSYQAKDTKTGLLLCDFKFKSGTFNSGTHITGGAAISIPGKVENYLP